MLTINLDQSINTNLNPKSYAYEIEVLMNKGGVLFI